MKRMLWASTAAVSLLAASAADAQRPGDGRAQSTAAHRAQISVFDARFFAQYAPRTAYDIARRVPGFSLDTAANSGEVRGFAGAAGNVVINGARPTSKAESLDVTLQRIPAQRVVRVELGPGNLYGSDYAGKNQVLNIILSEDAGFDANISASATRRYSGFVNTDAQGSVLLRRGPSTFNISASTGRNRQIEEGTDTLTDLASGELLEFRRKTNNFYSRDPFVAGSWTLEHGPDKAVRINARWQPSRYSLHQRNRVMPAGADPHDDSLLQHYRHPVIEIGGDLTRPLAGGAVKFVALATRRKRNDFDSYLQRDGLLAANANLVGGFEQIFKASRKETIGRISWARPDLLGFSVEAGAEGALNSLASKIELFSFDEDGDKARIDLPNDRADVKEKRGEGYVRVGRAVSPTVRADAGVNFEFSHLTVGGDTTADRKLRFLKPSLSIDWQPARGWRTRVSLRRTVAQLDFYDFISAAELATERVNAGNENLQPQRTWEVRLSAEHPLLGQGVAKLELGYDRVSMLQDRILICDADHPNSCFDAPGNLGTGTRAFARFDLDAPLKTIWDGLRFKGHVTLQRTRVDDPIDGRPRRFSGYFPDWEWQFEVRRDAQRWSYGLALNDNRRFTSYRTDEFGTNAYGSPYGTAFIEYRLNAKTAVRLDLDNWKQTSGNLDRLLFRPERLHAAGVFREFRERNQHMSVGLTLKQSFGGDGKSTGKSG